MIPSFPSASTCSPRTICTGANLEHKPSIWPPLITSPLVTLGQAAISWACVTALASPSSPRCSEAPDTLYSSPLGLPLPASRLALVAPDSSAVLLPCSLWLWSLRMPCCSLSRALPTLVPLHWSPPQLSCSLLGLHVSVSLTLHSGIYQVSHSIPVLNSTYCLLPLHEGCLGCGVPLHRSRAL